MEVRHDPFARGSYHRYSYYQDHLTEDRRMSCSWCGQRPARLFAYVWQSYDRTVPREPDHSQVFCNFSCKSDYHN